jgi:RNA polymerase sigma-70 factor (ECF subfamily)
MAKMATGDVEESLDIVQDAMFTLVKKYRHKPENQWKPLFYRILQNRIRDWQRRSRVRMRWRTWLTGKSSDEDSARNDPLENLADPSGEDPDRAAVREEVHQAITAALEKLSHRQQQTFMLRIWEGLSVAETATAMQCSQGSVKTHCSRALKALRGNLEGYRP